VLELIERDFLHLENLAQLRREEAEIMSNLTQKDKTVLQGPQRTEFSFGKFDQQNIFLEEKEWPVIIIGSSMVGMALSILLGYYG
jgi:hypothetical protein